MSHLDAAELHEYLDRGAVDERMKAVGDHVAGCNACVALLHTVEAERSAASSILRAAAPLQKPMPLFETLVPRPRYETLDSGVATDVSFGSAHGQYRLASMGLRGQAFVLAWAATIVLALGVGWFANAMYRANAERGAQTASVSALDATGPATSDTGRDATVDGTVDATVDGPMQVGALTSADAALGTAADTRTGAAAPAGADGRTGGDARSAPNARRGEARKSETAPPSAPARTAGAAAIASNAAISSNAANADARVDTPRSIIVAGERNRLAPGEQASSLARVEAAPAAQTTGTVRDAMKRDTLSLRAATDITPVVYPAEWSPISADSAAHLLGGEIVGIAGLENDTVVDYAVGGVGGMMRVRVRYARPGRDSIEVVQSARRSGSPMLGAAAAAVAGAWRSRYFRTIKWTDSREVTVIGARQKDVEAVGLYSFDPRVKR